MCSSDLDDLDCDEVEEYEFEESEEDKIKAIGFVNTKINNNYLSTHEQLYLNCHGEIAFAKLFNKCPHCGEKLNNIEGCKNCRNCGWSKCN